MDCLSVAGRGENELYDRWPDNMKKNNRCALAVHVHSRDGPDCTDRRHKPFINDSPCRRRAAARESCVAICVTELTPEYIMSAQNVHISAAMNVVNHTR